MALRAGHGQDGAYAPGRIFGNVQVPLFPTTESKDVVQEPQLLSATVGTGFNITSHHHVRCEKSGVCRLGTSPTWNMHSLWE